MMPSIGYWNVSTGLPSESDLACGLHAVARLFLSKESLRVFPEELQISRCQTDTPIWASASQALRSYRTVPPSAYAEGRLTYFHQTPRRAATPVGVLQWHMVAVCLYAAIPPSRTAPSSP